MNIKSTLVFFTSAGLAAARSPFLMAPSCAYGLTKASRRNCGTGASRRAKRD